jgi:hypothetical protein
MLFPALPRSPAFHEAWQRARALAPLLAWLAAYLVLRAGRPTRAHGTAAG